MEHIGELMRTLGEQDRALAAHLTEQGIPSEGKEGLIALVEKVGKLNFLPILFYDWDGVTLLGVGKARKADALAEQQALVNEAMRDFAISQMSAEDGAAYQAAGFDPANGTAHPAEGKPLSNKDGYTFGKWIPLRTEYGSSYGSAVSFSACSTIITIPEPEGYVFTEADRAGIVKVKAAYCTNQDLAAQIADNVHYINRDYSLTVTDCLRIGDSSNYYIFFSIKRQNRNGEGVLRTSKLGVKTTCRVAESDGTVKLVYSLLELTNADETQAHAVVNSSAESFFSDVIELCDDPVFGGKENWNEAATRADVSMDAKGENHDGFVELGNLTAINRSLRKAVTVDDLSAIDPQFDGAGLDITKAHGAQHPEIPLPVFTLPAAQKNLFDMYQSLPEDRRAAGLTWDEMQEAISNGTVWDAALNDGAGGWTNGFTGTYVPPEPTTTE